MKGRELRTEETCAAPPVRPLRACRWHVLGVLPGAVHVCVWSPSLLGSFTLFLWLQPGCGHEETRTCVQDARAGTAACGVGEQSCPDREATACSWVCSCRLVLGRWIWLLTVQLSPSAPTLRSSQRPLWILGLRKERLCHTSW